MAFTLLGGLGNTCVAFNAEKYGKAFEKFISYKSEYQMMVYVGIVTALVGIRRHCGGWSRARSGPTCWRWSSCSSAWPQQLTQMYYTSTIKQVSFFKTPPTNMRMYTTLLALHRLADCPPARHLEVGGFHARRQQRQVRRPGRRPDGLRHGHC